MLSDTYRQTYEIFWQCLERLQTQVQADPFTLAELQVAFQDTQSHFQQHILSLESADLDPSQASNMQAIHLEINKQLRLLNMDLLFLRTARQATTIQQRQAQMGDRLFLLKSYCTALLDKTPE